MATLVSLWRLIPSGTIYLYDFHIFQAMLPVYFLSTTVSCVFFHRPGSVLADYTISATSNNLDFSSANAALSSSLQAQGIFLAPDAFAQSGKDIQCLIWNPSHVLNA